jgi:hypothetical protein
MDAPSKTLKKRECRVICVYFPEEHYPDIVKNPEKFREFRNDQISKFPEAFPIGIEQGFLMKDQHKSEKLGTSSLIWLSRCSLKRWESLGVHLSRSSLPTSSTINRVLPNKGTKRDIGITEDSFCSFISGHFSAPRYFTWVDRNLTCIQEDKPWL